MSRYVAFSKFLEVRPIGVVAELSSATLDGPRRPPKREI
jgi:hypothetical protein